MLRASRASKVRSPYAGKSVPNTVPRPRKQSATVPRNPRPRADPNAAISAPTAIPQGLVDIGQVTASAPIILDAPSHPVTSPSSVNIPQQIPDVGTSQNGNIQGIEHFHPLNQVPNSFVSAVSPLAIHLPQKVKDKIFNNQFVNFGTLLFHDPSSTQQNHIVFEDGVFQVEPKHKKQTISNISQWLDAFAIFASVYLVKYPTEGIPLFRYMALIKRGAEKVKGNLLDYDIQFRLKKSFNISLCWAYVDAVWMLYMQSSTSVTNLQSRQQSLQPVLRNKCYKFSYQGICNRSNCNYLHSCLKCNLFHPLVKCFRNNSNVVVEQAPSQNNFNNHSRLCSRNQF